MSWILIITFYAGNVLTSGMSVSEFRTKKACETAVREVLFLGGVRSARCIEVKKDD